MKFDNCIEYDNDRFGLLGRNIDIQLKKGMNDANIYVNLKSIKIFENYSCFGNNRIFLIINENISSIYFLFARSSIRYIYSNRIDIISYIRMIIIIMKIDDFRI